MLEIIHDLAPGADLWFGSDHVGAKDPGQMINTIDQSIDAGCEIIVDDVYWPDEPWFTDGPLAQHISNKITSDDITYVSAAGNDAKTMWTGFFYGDGDGWLIFYNENQHDFIQNSFTVPDGDSARITLQWEDYWDDAPNNYDLFVFDNLDNLVASSTTVQGTGNNASPKEITKVINNVGGPVHYHIQVKKINGADVHLKVLVDDHPWDLDYTHSQFQSYPSEQIVGHCAADGVISVAAYPYNDKSTVEDFSSLGPTVIREFGGNYTQTRYTPTITATDGVQTTTPGYNPFDGTSAAAPHIAAIAALYFDHFGTSNKDPENFKHDLKFNADDIAGRNGREWYYDTGWGRANALKTIGDVFSVLVDQKNSNNDTLGHIGHWEGGPDFELYGAEHTFNFMVDATETFLGSQQILSGEKFHKWSVDDTVWNYRSFHLSADFPTHLTSQFAPVKNATVEAVTDGGTPLTNVQIQFKDPWLIDYTDPEFPNNSRNRGRNAPFKTLSSGNLGTDTNHHGVFLNQNATFEDGIPIYRLRGPAIGQVTQTEIYAFDHWEGTNTDFGNGVTTSSHRQTPVVFTGDNAHIKAVYSPANERENYTLTIPSDQTLTLQPGGNYRFADGFKLKLGGPLIISGTISQPIRLSAADHSWDGIYNQFGAQNLTISHTQISGVDTALALYGTFNELNLSDITFNGAVVFGNPETNSGEPLVFDHLTFNNINGTALTITDPQVEVNLSNLDFKNVDTGMLFNTVRYPVSISNMEMIKGGTGLVFQNLHSDVDKLVSVNHSLLAQMDQAIVIDTPELINNNIERVQLDHTTISDTPLGIHFMQSCGDRTDGDIAIINSILWNNQGHDIYPCGDYVSYWKIEYTDMQGATQNPNPGNIDQDPKFVDAGGADYHLSWDSPCIDAGDPNVLDPDSTASDMGAFYHPQLSGDISSDMNWNGAVSVASTVDILDNTTVTIDPGTQVYLANGATLTVHGTLEANGQYNNRITLQPRTGRWSRINVVNGTVNLNRVDIQTALYGIQGSYASGSVSNCVFDDIINPMIYLVHSTGFTIYGTELSGGGTGIMAAYSPIAIKSNTVDHNSYYGIYLTGSSAFLKENSIQDNGDGIIILNSSDANLVVSRDAGGTDVNNVIANNDRYGIYVDGNSQPLLGYYEYISGLGMFTGGFNDFRPGNGSYDVYSAQPVVVDARLNWWPASPQLSGNLNIHPAAGELGLGKGTVATNPTPDSLPPAIRQAIRAELDSNYQEAAEQYTAYLRQYPETEEWRPALAGLVRTSYSGQLLLSLQTRLNEYYQGYPTTLFGMAAARYSMTVMANEHHYFPALERGDSLLIQYQSTDLSQEASAGVLFEQVTLYDYLEQEGSGLGKISAKQITSQLNNKLRQLVDDFGTTKTGKLAQSLYGNRLKNLASHPVIPVELVLQPAYPNPFNPTTTISYGLPKDQQVKLIIYDLTGRQVKTLVNAQQSAGMHSIQWDGTNGYGQQVSSGVYFYRLTVSRSVKTHKMLLIR